MAEAYFININKLKEDSLIDDNVDAKLLLPTLRMVQDIYIQKILGTPMFNDLKTKIIADPTLAAYTNHLALMKDYITNVIIYYVLMHTPFALKFRLMNKGTMVKSGENSSAADTADLHVIKDEFRMIAESYAELLTMYLKENKATFVLYDTATTTGVTSATGNYSTGIYLDD